MRRNYTGIRLRSWLVCVAALTTCSLFVSGCTAGEPSEFEAPINEEPSEFEVPINLRNAHDIGGLQFELAYDPEVLKVLAVMEGSSSSSTMAEFNTDSPGRVVIGIVDEEGINGDVLSATVKFEVLQRGTPCTLSIANVVAYDVATLNTVPSSSTPGAFEGDADSVTFPVLMFSS